MSDTTAKHFKNLISYLNTSWNVLSDWHGPFFLYLHSFTPKNGCNVGQYFKNHSIFQITIFWTIQPCFIIFCVKIEYHKTLKMMSLFWKNAYMVPKRAKRSKSGWSSWTKSTFFVYCSKLAHWIFLIFCIELEGIKGYKLPQTPFFGKILIFPKKGKNGPKIDK